MFLSFYQYFRSRSKFIMNPSFYVNRNVNRNVIQKVKPIDKPNDKSDRFRSTKELFQYLSDRVEYLDCIIVECQEWLIKLIPNCPDYAWVREVFEETQRKRNTLVNSLELLYNVHPILCRGWKLERKKLK